MPKMRIFKKDHSFAHRLTIWITVSLLTVMILITAVLSFLVKKGMTEEADKRYQEAVERTNESISRLLSNVETAVVNNIRDIEEVLYKPDEIRIVFEEILMRNPDVFGCGIGFKPDYYPQKGRWFEPYMKQGRHGEMVYEQIGGEHHNYLEMEWFRKPMTTGEAYWTQPYRDETGAEVVVCTYTFPVKDANGNRVGVLGADICLDVLSDFLMSLDVEMNNRHMHKNTVHDSLSYHTRSFIIGHDGTYITHKNRDFIINKNFFKEAAETVEKDDDRIVADLKQGKRGHQRLMLDDHETMVYYAPLRSTGWSMLIMVPTASLYGPGNMMVKIMAFLMLVTLVVISKMCSRSIARMTKPLSQFADSAKEIAKGNFNSSLPPIKTDDEIGLLHDSFEHMQQSLRQYVEDLKATTASKAAIEHELQLASGIQMSMLPKKFPPFPERQDIDVYGMLTPAKAVGGDLFDFYIRDEKLFFCIGDVSGKGVPAALLMTVTKNLFHAISSQRSQPAQIVQTMNGFMSENNEKAMFVTLFVGVLDLVTGLLHYCNAGHDAPMLLHHELTILPVKSNLPVGLMPEMKFQEQEMMIESPSTLFLYTDGLTEAENKRQDMFGSENLQVVLREAMAEGILEPEPLVGKVSEVVKEFVGNADQSDDQTLFAIRYMKQ